MRAVVDTNVVVSAFLAATSSASRAFDRAGQEFTLLASATTIEELTVVLFRSKFDRYLSQHARSGLLATYIRSVERVEVSETIRACRDPRDDKFLSLAVSGHADLILSGDADLLAVHPFRKIAILSPAEYLGHGSFP